MIAFKTYKDCPPNILPPSIPSEWVWQSLEIPDDRKDEFEANGFTVLSYSDFVQYKAQRQEAFDLWANAYDQNMKGQELRVIDLVDEQFAQWHPSKIDFRKHLQPNIYLQKNVIMLPNGRPQKALYSHNNELIAEIAFEFETNIFNFMIRRIERLAYYKRNGDVSEQWVIADDMFDQNNPYHLREMMKERSEARALIIEEVKAFLNGVLAQFYVPQGKTYPEILEIAGNFWDAYGGKIDSWINVGAPQFRSDLTVDVAFDFLDFEFTTGVTVRQYVLNKTQY